MHLIVFPFIIFSFISIPVLLLWPGRGFNGKNYLLVVSSGMAGLIFGFVLSLLISQMGLNPTIFVILTFVFFPAIFAIFSIQKYGSKGVCLAKKDAVIFTSPLFLLISYIVANFVGLGAAWLSLAWLTNLDAAGFVLVMAAIKVPVSLVFTALICFNLSNPKPIHAVAFSIFFGSIGLILLVTGVFTYHIAVPLFMYTLVTPPTLIFVLIWLRGLKPNKYSQQDAANDAAPLL